MAGYTTLYCIGGEGGFQGADGINPMAMQIWVGESDRMWLEARYFDPGLKPMGKARVFIPNGPNDKHMLLDACLMFAPGLFPKTKTILEAEKALGSRETVDFSVKGGMPPMWADLRKEMAEKAAFCIWKAMAEPVELILKQKP